MDGHANANANSNANDKSSSQQKSAASSSSPSQALNPTLSASSPIRSGGPISDYSPLKGSKTIASFFTPPQPLKQQSQNGQSSLKQPSSLSNSTSPPKQQQQPSMFRESESESDLTLSEGDSESESESVHEPAKNKVEEKAEEQSSTESTQSDSPDSNEHDSSESDISVIIDLPSTDDSNELAATTTVPSKRYNDDYFSATDYEVSDDSEAADIPIEIDSSAETEEEEDDDDHIPVMAFNSNQITIPPESPKKEMKKMPGPAVVKASSVNSSSTPSTVKPPSPKRRALESTEMPVTSTTTSSNATAVSNAAAAVNMAAYHLKFASPATATSIPRPNPMIPSHTHTHTLSNDLLSSNVSYRKTGYVYDERMLHHFDPHDSEHPEKPARITCIYEKLRDAKLLDRAHRIPIQVKLAEFSPEVQSIHDPKYCRMINQTSLIRNLDELHQISSQFNSVYINPSTAISATVAAAATIELCQAIGRGQIENGFAIVRPPGHHAEHDEAMGFCIYNNVAVAASSLLRKNLARRILILDWDVHHGNGTQNAFAESGDVLYVSLHRYDGAKFYPHVEEANCTYVGSGTSGLGKSVNVAWSGAGYGDADYLYAFSRLIMPIAREFNPDFVIVSAGFDAAAGDPIGECDLSTYGYSMMLQELMSLAGGKLAVVLEGGYNLEVISKCYEACVRMLLKEAPPLAPGPMIASPKAILAVESTVLCQSHYWKCLFPKPAHIPHENIPQYPLPVILDHFWREECKRKFNLTPIPGLFKSCSESLVQKYSNRVLASEGALFNPDVLIVFAHESGPVHSSSFISSLCLQPGKIAQSLPFLPLLQHFHEQGSAAYSFIDINLPTRTWKLKQTALTNESESQELNVLFTLLWDRLIARSGCKNVFFVASGSPIYAIGNLLNTRGDIEAQVRGCFFFSSSLFIPIINSSPARSAWYQRNAHVIVPSQEPIKKAIGNAAAAFGSCFSAGQWLMADSAAAVGDFKLEILNFIRTRLIQKYTN